MTTKISAEKWEKYFKGGKHNEPEVVHPEIKAAENGKKNDSGKIDIKNQKDIEYIRETLKI